MNITADSVKQLRERTGAGMMECKKALVETKGDLDAAAEDYRRLGFTVGARNRHPWGTHNAIVQFPGVFIELLTVGGVRTMRLQR